MNSNAKSASQREKDDVIKLTKSPDSTHIRTVSNSVGIALLTLTNIYMKDEKTVDAACTQCARELSATDEKSSEFKAAIEYILKKAKEDTNVFDRVTLWLPVGNEFVDQQHTFPLRKVLALVWLAIHDNNKYTHNYTGTPDQQLEQAKEDSAKRLDSFYNCLERIRTEQVCHHGNRNELVFTLNGIYQGIHLIEDEQSTTLSFLREKINKKFWETYHDAKTSETDKAELNQLLFAWMESGNATAIINKIDPNKSHIKELGQLFINNGVNPASIKLDALVADRIPYLAFSCDPTKHKDIYNINIILNFPDDKNIALSDMKKWIKENYPSKKTEDLDKISHFARIYQTYLDINQNKFLLEITKNNVSSLLNTCEKFIKNLNTALPTGLLKEIDQFYEIFKKCKSDISPIENFFAYWYEAIADNHVNQEALRTLYPLLFQESFTAKIKLLDSEILKFTKSISPTGELHIEPYLINRIFLHAILVEPHLWSQLFKEALHHVLKFVENNFNQETNVVKAQSLQASSYPKDLIDQLHYITKDKKDSKEADVRPDTSIAKTGNTPRVILLPSQYHSLHEAYYFMTLLDADEKLKENTYLGYKYKFDQLTQKYCHDFISHQETAFNSPNVSFSSRTTIELISHVVPINFHRTFLKSEPGQKVINTFYPNRAKCLAIELALIPESLWCDLLMNAIQEIITTPEDIYKFICYYSLAYQHQYEDLPLRIFNLLYSFSDSYYQATFNFSDPSSNTRYWFHKILPILQDITDLSFLDKLGNELREKYMRYDNAFITRYLDSNRDGKLPHPHEKRYCSDQPVANDLTLPTECIEIIALTNFMNRLDEKIKEEVYSINKHRIHEIFLKELNERQKEPELHSNNSLAIEIIKILPGKEKIPFFESMPGQQITENAFTQGKTLALFLSEIAEQDLPYFFNKIFYHLMNKRLDLNYINELLHTLLTKHNASFVLEALNDHLQKIFNPNDPETIQQFLFSYEAIPENSRFEFLKKLNINFLKAVKKFLHSDAESLNTYMYRNLKIELLSSLNRNPQLNPQPVINTNKLAFFALTTTNDNVCDNTKLGIFLHTKLSEEKWSDFFNEIGYESLKAIIRIAPLSVTPEYADQKYDDERLIKFLNKFSSNEKRLAFFAAFNAQGVKFFFEDEKHLESILSKIKLDEKDKLSIKMQFRQKTTIPSPSNSSTSTTAAVIDQKLHKK